MPTKKWLAYNDLAWTDSIISSPGDDAGETGFYVNLIKENAETQTKNLLHLGCGAGFNDYIFKKHFKVTGVDISKKMLEIAKKNNPEVTYLQGDMRSLHLNQYFDVVVIPDSIDYMVTQAELQRAIATACKHLLPGGLLLIVAKTREQFSENNFCYTGAKGGVELTIFENNYVPKNDPSTYEATIIYLIRQDGELSIHTDIHRLGLFSQSEWHSLLKDAGLNVKESGLDGVYDPYIMGQGRYPMTVFMGTTS